MIHLCCRCYHCLQPAEFLQLLQPLSPPCRKVAPRWDQALNTRAALTVCVTHRLCPSASGFPTWFLGHLEGTQFAPSTCLLTLQQLGPASPMGLEASTLGVCWQQLCSTVVMAGQGELSHKGIAWPCVPGHCVPLPAQRWPHVLGTQGITGCLPLHEEGFLVTAHPH